MNRRQEECNQARLELPKHEGGSAVCATRRATFNVMFLIQKGKAKANGQAPILARLTVNQEMIHFSTKMYVLPERWDPKHYRTLGLTKDEKNINALLDELKSAVQRRYFDMQASSEVITASKIKQVLFSTDEKSITLMALFDKYISDYEKLVLTQDYGQESFFRYKICRSRVAEYIQKQYKVSDYPLADINRKFLDNLYLWLRSEHKLNNNTTVKFIHRFSSVFKMARDNGWVSGDPFKLQKLHLDKVDRGYLTEDEIERIYNKEFASERLSVVRDMFIFSCYTGLAYIDAKALTYDMLKTWPDGNIWISSHRKKTKVPVNVRLLDVPLQIIEKYRGQTDGVHVLPIPTNQKCNDYLKEIASVCGINKELCYHMARHTFATTITLGNGVPIESVSKMLGHTNIKTTQIYARITDQKINGDMEMLAEKLNGTLPPKTATSAKTKRQAGEPTAIECITTPEPITIITTDGKRYSKRGRVQVS